MAIHPRQFGIVLKNARMDKKLTQAELAEILDISLPYLKDLERFRNNPSYDVFEKVIRYFNLSADTVIYPNENLTNTDYSGSPAHPGRSSAQPDRASAHLIRSAVQLMPVADQHTC